MKLIHSERYFKKEEILDRARKYEFPNPLAVEIFLWDCELAAQFQEGCPKIVLKGGAAAQLHLPLEMQRGSRDIDIIAPLEMNEISVLISDVSKSVGDYVRFELHKPKKPVPKLPLVTYFAKMPTKLNLRKREELEIKIDISLESIDLPSVELRDVRTFAVKVKRMRCLTVGSLVGDKLLTLAKGSIGMEDESDYPKQIYDIDALLESTKISEKTVNQMVTSINSLTKIEAGYRNIEITPFEALDDVIATMNEYSLIDTSGGNTGIKKNIEAFQQFFVSKNRRCPYYEWSSKTLKIRFLTRLILEYMNNNLTKSEVVKLINKSQELSSRLRKISGPIVVKLRKDLLGLAKTRIPYFKEMKGKPLDRVFWQIVTPYNLENVESLL